MVAPDSSRGRSIQSMSLIVHDHMHNGSERRFRVRWWKDGERIREEWKVFSKSKNRWVDLTPVQSEYVISHKPWLLGELHESIPDLPSRVLRS